MDIRHQKLTFSYQFSMLLPFDGTHGDGAALVYVEAVSLSGIHLGVGGAVAVKGTLADLRVDAPWDEEGDADVVVFQLQRFVEAEQGMFCGAVGRTQRKAEQTR